MVGIYVSFQEFYVVLYLVELEWSRLSVYVSCNGCGLEPTGWNGHHTLVSGQRRSYNAYRGV